MSLAAEDFALTLTRDEPATERELDPGIRDHVAILRAAGIETFESCQGGEGHAFHEPTVRFHGDASEGFRALAVALRHSLKVSELRRYYSIQDGEPHGPHWEMTFFYR
jgi:hypothetical protein